MKYMDGIEEMVGREKMEEVVELAGNRRFLRPVFLIVRTRTVPSDRGVKRTLVLAIGNRYLEWMPLLTSDRGYIQTRALENPGAHKARGPFHCTTMPCQKYF
ncbi:hypothetical protein E2C01_085203 [Portunus trituberculatus]|uniref:Uncharacterized protein n=1 Tax=Portunus trituberculatus TaxID=210409 RepID=A0A5B7J651_PORTR|nr:hypothetical protein [Portunus trituberculatus]